MWRRERDYSPLVEEREREKPIIRNKINRNERQSNFNSGLSQSLKDNFSTASKKSSTCLRSLIWETRRQRQELPRTERETGASLKWERQWMKPCVKVRETGNDGGIVSPVAEELTRGERVSVGGEKGWSREGEGRIDRRWWLKNSSEEWGWALEEREGDCGRESEWLIGRKKIVLKF